MKQDLRNVSYVLLTMQTLKFHLSPLLNIYSHKLQSHGDNHRSSWGFWLPLPCCFWCNAVVVELLCVSDQGSAILHCCGCRTLDYCTFPITGTFTVSAARIVTLYGETKIRHSIANIRYSSLWCVVCTTAARVSLQLVELQISLVFQVINSCSLKCVNCIVVMFEVIWYHYTTFCDGHGAFSTFVVHYQGVQCSTLLGTVSTLGLMLVPASVVFCKVQDAQCCVFWKVGFYFCKLVVLPVLDKYVFGKSLNLLFISKHLHRFTLTNQW